MAIKAEAFATQKGWQVLANVQSEYAGHIEKELAGRFIDETDLIMLIGGDGTLRELIAGLQTLKRQTEIAFIPMGNANVVARELNIPLKPQQALKMLESSKVACIDIGILDLNPKQDAHSIYQQSLIFLAMIEIGFGAKIVHLVNQLRLGKLSRLYQLWGDLVYAIAGVLAFIQKNSDETELSTHNQQASSKHLVISNMKTYAKGWALTPNANCQDGLLNIAVNNKGSRLSTLMTFLLAAQGKPNSNKMTYSQAKEVILKGSSKAYMQVDGDPISFSGYAEVRVEPKAYNIHIPHEP